MTTSPDRITPAALAALLTSTEPHAVLDVRERGAYERGHIFRTTALPRRWLEFRLPALVPAPATPLVVVDADGGALAARARTTAQALGYPDVRVLDGGLAGWRAAGRPTVQGINVPSKVFGERALHELKTPQISPGELAERIARGDDMVIVDTRTPAEYRGETRRAERAGHIPGAVNFDWMNAIDQARNLRLKPADELKRALTGLGVTPDKEIIAYCQTHHRSAHTYIVLKSLGYPRVRGYPGSWSEWGNSPETPIE
jgi:thiosulfate/3-mercaptopyruvate sulfurtransferase